MTGDSALPRHTAPKLSTVEVNLFLAEEFPRIAIGRAFKVEETRYGFARMRMCFGDHLPRPGGTISGPSMFALAGITMYAAVLASAGPIAHAVTANLNIDFPRKPGQRNMIGEACILKPGKRLAVGEIAPHSGGEAELAAHATATYSLPA